MKIDLTVVFLILAFVIPGVNCFGQITFQKTYMANNGLPAYCVQQTSDGGYIICSGPASSAISFIKTNAYGDTLWTKTYGGTNSDRGYSAQQTTDGGYIITGSYALGKVYLIKISSIGDTLWTKAYGGIYADEGYSVQQTTDRGYIIAGVTFNFGPGLPNVYLIKTDSTGSLSWSKAYGGALGDWGYSVQQTNDGGYIIAGATKSFGAGSYDCYLIKTDTSGTVTWSKTFGGINDDLAYSVRQTSDSGYILAGTTKSFGDSLGDIYLIKTDMNGDTLWTRTFDHDGDIGYSVRQTIDGGYIISGTMDIHVYLIKTDAFGYELWLKIFPGTGLDGSGYCAEQTSDGGYIVAGGTEVTNDSMGIVPVAYLIKTDANGSSGCNEITTSTIENTPATIVSSPATIETLCNSSTTFPATVVSSGVFVSTLCTSVGINTINNPQSAISIYPNPSSGLFNISDNTKAAIVKTEVHNYTGEKVFASAGTTIDLTNAAAGIYFYSVTLKDGTMARGKIVKE